MVVARAGIIVSARREHQSNGSQADVADRIAWSPRRLA